MSREFICQKFCFGYKNRRWKVGEKIMVSPEEEKNVPVFFVPVEKFVTPDLGIAGGPRNDGVLKKLEKITKTAMSPDTEAFLEKADSPEPSLAVSPEETNNAENVPAPAKRSRRLGTKNK